MTSIKQPGINNYLNILSKSLLVETGFKNKPIIKKEGIILMVVPFITNKVTLKENIWNIYHVSNFSILGWYTKFCRYFHDVEVIRSNVKLEWADKNGKPYGIEFKPEDTKITEDDFMFEKYEIKEFETLPDNFSAVVFILQNPRKNILPPTVKENIPEEWEMGKIYSEVRKEIENGLNLEITYWRSEFNRLKKENEENKKYFEAEFKRLKE